jgi:hypothetical protein
MSGDINVRPVYGTLYLRADQITPRVNRLDDGRVILTLGTQGGVEMTLIGSTVNVCDLLTETCRLVAASEKPRFHATHPSFEQEQEAAGNDRYDQERDR